MDMNQSDLPLQDQAPADNGPVECLGKTFANDEERRTYFLGLLAKKLKDPEFRKIEGFPIGEDEDMLNLSDPPYYTACPNPWIADFIAEWETKNPEKESGYHYHREPFAADVSEGKNDPIYNAHSYHTKVPHKAIMRYILHFTEPGDIVFDGFAGTGMAGIAAQLCGDRNTLLSMGYQVKPDGTILQQDAEADKTTWKPISKLGARRCILNDLSPAATFISHNYNTPVDLPSFDKEASKILEEAERECGWMYETLHSDGVTSGRINYTVWSDVFICSECTGEVVFWETAVNKDTGKVSYEFSCPHCRTKLVKRQLECLWMTTYDHSLKKNIEQSKQVPVLINYSINGEKKSFNKRLDASDFECIDKIENSKIPYWYPSNRMIEGKETRRNDRVGITHVHHFYTKRNLWILSKIRDLCNSSQTLLLFNSQLINISKLNRYRPGVSYPYNPLSGTMYIGSQISESNVFTAYKNKLKKLKTAFKDISSPSIITTQSLTSPIDVKADYIFIDPPFGANLNYSELSSLWEEWLRVKTNNKMEAIENSA
ncbi:MAG: DNA methyltransferase, partial [Endozoicomonas sp.]|uniref:DNA methyltransferase n=1 Tax=Endozoicomonas sp. TaxID=1892382 RepID=UPI003D9BD96B